MFAFIFDAMEIQQWIKNIQSDRKILRNRNIQNKIGNLTFKKYEKYESNLFNQISKHFYTEIEKNRN